MATQTSNGADRRQTLFCHLKALNSQFLSWVQDQARTCPAEDWSDGVQDYLDHIKSLQEEFADCLQEQPSRGPTINPCSLTPLASHSPPQSVHAAATAALQFALESQPGQGNNSSGPSLFGAATAGTLKLGGSDAGTSFGSAGASALKPTTFGAPALPAFGCGTSAPFGAGAAAPAFGSFGSASFGGQDGATGEDDEGPSEAEQANYKPEVQAADNEAAGAVLFKAKGKAFVLQNSRWEKKAFGQLTLRRPPSGRPFVNIMSDAGRNLFTAIIPAKAKFNLVPKDEKVTQISFSGIYSLPDAALSEQKAQMGNVMFHLGGANAIELNTLLQKVAGS